MKRIYFDNAATTPLDNRVLKAMRPFLTKHYGNPSSTHKEGRIARQAIKKAREQCAKALGCNVDEIFFTSGASESNSWASKIFDGLFTTPLLHDSLILANQKKMKNYGYNPPMIKAISLINNETGSNDYEEYCRNQYSIITGEIGDIFLDLTSAIGHVYIDLHDDGHIVGASLSGHKFGAPKGVGVLYVRKDQQSKMESLIYGHQENGMRGGTENVTGIVGMGKAIELATKEMDKNNSNLENIISYIMDSIDTINYKTQTHNHIINFTFKHLLGATAVQIFDQYGIAVSAGSACNSDSETPSHTLLHSAYTELEALRTIRISIGKQNTSKEAQRFIKVLKEVIDKYDVD